MGLTKLKRQCGYDIEKEMGQISFYGNGMSKGADDRLKRRRRSQTLCILPGIGRERSFQSLRKRMRKRCTRFLTGNGWSAFAAVVVKRTCNCFLGAVFSAQAK